jgi:3-oxoadipate enol-lactonase
MQPSEKELEVRVNDIVVSYNDAGKGNPLTLIFIHGFPFNKNSWNPQLDALSSKYRCIAFDLRGFGNTHFGTQDSSIELFADDLDAFMDILQIQSAVICGLSMGGYIALRAALKYPHRFKGLILSDTQCIADSPEAKEKRYKVIEQIETSGLEAYAEASLKNLFHENSLANKKDVVHEIHQTILSTSPATIISALKALANRTETCSMLGEIGAFTLVVCGKEDKVTPPAQAVFLSEHIGSSRLEIIGEAAHLSNLEQPDKFNAAVVSFLKVVH